MFKDLLFAIFGYVGVVAIILGLIWFILELLNKIFKFSKYMVLYRKYKRERDIPKSPYDKMSAESEE